MTKRREEIEEVFLTQKSLILPKSASFTSNLNFAALSSRPNLGLLSEGSRVFYILFTLNSPKLDMNRSWFLFLSLCMQIQSNIFVSRFCYVIFVLCYGNKGFQ